MDLLALQLIRYYSGTDKLSKWVMEALTQAERFDQVREPHAPCPALRQPSASPRASPPFADGR